MRSDKPDLDDAIRELAAEDRETLAEHPDPEALLAYHEGALAEDQADRVQEHLARCPDCAQAVLDFAAFPGLEPPGAEHRLSPAEVRSRWRELERRLARPARPVWQRHHVLLPLAAAFFLAAVGLAVWAGSLRERVERLEGPRGDVFVVGALRPEGASLRGGEPPEVPDWAGRVVVYLPLPPGGSDHPAYEVDAVSRAGRRVLAGLPVRPSPEGLVALDLPRELLGEGEVTFELFGLERGSRREVARYPLSVDVGRQ
jgi:hypothetical protein